MKFCAVDLGASSTRFTSNSGKVSVIPNNMVFLEKDAFVDIKPHEDTLVNSLEVVIEKDGDSEFYPVKVLIGAMAERYSSENDRPSVMMNKHKQRINYVSGIVATAFTKIMDNVEEDIDLYVALPPIEVRHAKEIVSSNFLGKYKVTLPKYKGGTVLEFTIKSVNCHEESLMSLTSFFFNTNGTPNEKSKPYYVGNVLSLDIGASTTDLAIVKNARYNDKSGQTYKTGGNIARDYLIDEIRMLEGYDLPIEDAERTMAEGRLQMGNTYKDVSDIVDRAKRKFAKSVVLHMQGYFRQIDIPIQTIRAIIVSGGGSLSSQFIQNGEVVETTKPMSYYITEYLQEICSGVDVVPYGEDSRLANIKGLYIRASLDNAKKSKTA